MIKKIGLIAVFLLAACLSFFITRQIKSLGEVIVEDVDTTIVEDVDTTIIVDNDTTNIVMVPDTTVNSPDNPLPPKPKPIVLKASKPIEEDNQYSFRASYVGELMESCHYELWSNKLVAKSENGSFVNIPAIKGGKYKLCLVGNESGKSLASPIFVKGFIDVNSLNPSPNPVLVDTRKKMISEEDFQKRMLTQGDHTLDGGKIRGKKSFVTKGFRVIVINAPASEDEFVPSDIQDVRDMIYTYGKWKSARVVELEYDASGYVTLAKVEPVL